jgi:hypothetical protein
MPYKILRDYKNKKRCSGYVEPTNMDGYYMDDPQPDYCYQYPKGAIVEAKEGTMGIFCFDTFEHADDYLNCSILRRYVVQVKGIDEQPLPEEIAFSDTVLEFYHRKKGYGTQLPPDGTILFRAIVCLE